MASPLKNNSLGILIELRKMAYNGYTVQQIAACLQLSESTVKAKLQYWCLPVTEENRFKKPSKDRREHFIKHHASDMYVEEIASMISKGKQFVLGVMKKHGLTPILSPAQTPKLKPLSERKERDKLIIELSTTMCVEDISQKVGLGIYCVADKIRAKKITPKWRSKVTHTTSKKHYEKYYEDDAKVNIQRPKAEYSNTTPYGIAKDLHQQKQG
jgi:transposase